MTVNKQRYETALRAYKAQFDDWWQDEKYKWQAIKWFQEHFDMEADDFGAMFQKATLKHVNLLDSASSFPRRQILSFAQADDEGTRAMFASLYDESQDLSARIAQFTETTKDFLAKRTGKWNTLYQRDNAISTYLWLRYPDKHYIYKYEVALAMAKYFCPDETLIYRGDPDNVKKDYALCDEVRTLLMQDEELVQLFRSKLDDTTYDDPQLVTLTDDFGYFIHKRFVDSCWFVGARMVAGDQFEHFIQEGIWDCDPSDKLSPLVNSIKGGDLIAIKAAYTQKHNLPIGNDGKHVSAMNIKAVGTVLKNNKDGHSLKVKWKKVFDEPKQWLLFTNRSTLWKVERTVDDWMYGALLDFTFADVPQDYGRFLQHPYWASQYNINEEETLDMTPYDKYIHLLKANRNIILTGAPGTGKTTLAKAIAQAMGCAEPGFVQFHPSYDYTDFVEGLRPIQADGAIQFERKDGVFKAFCKKALSEDDKPCVFIIDEINRGELSKIFGELFFSIDPGYRGERGRVSTQYQNLVPDGDTFGKGFFVPENVYIIGTMNDIDRSVESMDFAMRRRFTWVEISAEESAENIPITAEAKGIMLRLNEAIAKTEGLDENYQLGAAYFLDDLSDEERWRLRIKGLLREYLRGIDPTGDKLGKLKEAYFQQQESE